MTTRNLHLELVSARTALRLAQDELTIVKAYAEQRAIGALNGSAGKNEDERKRTLTIALSRDTSYCEAVSCVRDAEYAVAMLEAELETEHDTRRRWEWEIRCALVEAIGGTVSSVDQSFDEVATEQVTQRVVTIATEGSIDELYN